jgi:hypothetical protein
MDISATSGLRVPHGTEVQRPSASGSSEYGIIRYNTDSQGFEGYGITGWSGLGGVKDVDGDTFITARQGGVDTDVLAFTAGDVLGMTLSSTDLSVNAHVIFENDASLNGIVEMESDLYVVGDVSLNSSLDVGGDVTFNSNLQVYGTIDVSNGINALTSNIAAGSFSIGSVNQFDLESGDIAPIAAGGTYLHFEAGFRSSGDVSLNTTLAVGGATTLDSTLVVGGDITIGGDILPIDGIDGSCNLGSADKPFAALYVSNNTIYFQGSGGDEDVGTLSFEAGGIKVQSEADRVADGGAGRTKELLSVVNNKVGIGKSSKDATANLDVVGTILTTGDITVGGRTVQF